ncbi:MAG TPA: replicative DNA helicase [Clostridiales bacterium]|nr:replicative DNA helicase [Clostridiales bacterium]
MEANMRIPPHSQEAECSVLGALLLDRDALSDVASQLKDADFYEEAHREIYRAIIDLYQGNQAVDLLTVSEALKRRNSLEMVGGRAYIAQLTAEVPSTANALQYARIIIEKATLRRLIKAASDITEQAYQGRQDPETILDSAEQAIFNIAAVRQNKDYVPLRDVLQSNVQEISQLEKNGGGMTGLETGFIDLDLVTSGLQRSDLIVIAARPGMGKTSFALNIAHQTAVKNQAGVLIFSLEMSKEQLGMRLLSMESRIELQYLRTGNLQSPQDKWKKINSAINKLLEGRIFIDDTAGISIMEMRNKCRRLKSENKLDLIVIDYLQLMQYDGRVENRQQEITALTRQLKQLAREMDCPVILLSQLSRAPEQRTGDQRRPVLSDLRESGAIEQDADIVIFLYRDDYYNQDTLTPNICEVNIAKHRNGQTKRIELNWNGAFTRFTNKETRYSEADFDPRQLSSHESEAEQ